MTSNLMIKWPTQYNTQTLDWKLRYNVLMNFLQDLLYCKTVSIDIEARHKIKIIISN